MIFRFKKGKHRAWPLYWLKWWPVKIDPVQIWRRVVFPFDAKYRFTDEAAGDQQDNNKLIGFCFGWRVHDCSARFGWRYDPVKDKFILSAYCYKNGVRSMEDLCDCVANHFYDLRLRVMKDRYVFQVYNENEEDVGYSEMGKGHKRWLAFLLGPYFGGNQAAPANISLTLKK